jgi:hypothetical protein
MVDKPIHIELTPKRYKLLQMVGGIAAVLGFVAWLLTRNAYIQTSIGGHEPSMLPMYAASAMVVVGFLIYCSGRFLAWWNHG